MTLVSVSLEERPIFFIIVIRCMMTNEFSRDNYFLKLDGSTVLHEQEFLDEWDERSKNSH